MLDSAYVDLIVAGGRRRGLLLRAIIRPEVSVYELLRLMVLHRKDRHGISLNRESMVSITKLLKDRPGMRQPLLELKEPQLSRRSVIYLVPSQISPLSNPARRVLIRSLGTLTFKSFIGEPQTARLEQFPQV